MNHAPGIERAVYAPDWLYRQNGQPGKAITLLVPSEVPWWRRMVHSLGQTVTLQQLALDEKALVTGPNAQLEVSVTQKHEHNGKPRQAYGRKQVSLDQERGRFARSKHGNQ